MRELGPVDWQETGVEEMTPKQQRMLNCLCGDIAAQIVWHGYRMSKDSWRHFISAVILKQPIVPGFDMGNGERGFVVLQRSSKELTKTQASEAITQLIVFGDDPASQGQKQPAVRWCDKALLGMGLNPNDFREAA